LRVRQRASPPSGTYSPNVYCDAAAGDSPLREGTVVHSESCIACDVVGGVRRTPGGVLLRQGGFVLHALADPSPLRGWVVLTSDVHARAWPDLGAGALAALGPLAARVMSSQRTALGAEHVYAFSIGDAVRHFHLHLVPRYADTPERLRGRRCFEGQPEDMLPEPELARAATMIREVLCG
jgi:diadenosine tetraphosphate (Ap4A) HIT family hydrolase